MTDGLGDDEAIEAVMAALKAGTTWFHGASRSHSCWRVRPGGPDAHGAFMFIEDVFDEGFVASAEHGEEHMREVVRRSLPAARGILPKAPRRRN